MKIFATGTPTPTMYAREIFLIRHLAAAQIAYETVHVLRIQTALIEFVRSRLSSWALPSQTNNVKRHTRTFSLPTSCILFPGLPYDQHNLTNKLQCT